MSNLKPSVVSLSAFVRGTANEKLKGPMGVNQSTAKPVADLILLLSSDESLHTFFFSPSYRHKLSKADKK